MTFSDPLELVGETVAEKYLVERVVGEGGFAIVYRAIHQIWNRPVALKVFKALDEVPAVMRDRLLKEFVQEGALLAELSEKSAAIVQARDVGMLTTKRGGVIPYMVLEWLEGRSLEAMLEGERRAGSPPRTLDRAMAILQPVARALALAHERGIAHRDVKPANVFVLGDPEAAEPSVKLLDFGIAKVVQDAQKMSGSFTKTSGQITSFTPAYGAPEQFSRDYGATGPWTDVFALALIFVELLTGREPLGGDTLTQLAFASVDPNKRPTPRALGAHLPDAVEAVFARALQVRPEARFSTAGELWTALDAAARGEVSEAATGRTVLARGALAEASRPSPGTGTDLNPMGGAPGIVPAADMSAPSASRRKSKMPIVLGLGATLLVAVGGVVALSGRGDGKGSGGVSPSTLPPSTQSMATTAAASASAAPAKAAEQCPPDMVYIPGGTFFMGSKEAPGVPAHETPPHPVKLSPYCIDRHEVTVARYMDCAKGKGCERIDDSANNLWDAITPSQKKVYDPICNFTEPDKRTQHPANCISWDQAATYCHSQGGDLPTEAQWEYAARGENQYKFPWGDNENLDGRLNACGAECLAWGKKNDAKNFVEAMYTFDDTWVHTAPVGSFKAGASPFGVEDMSGNVFEWVRDVIEPYPKKEGGVRVDAQVDPEGPPFAKGAERGVRGGAWNSVHLFWLRPTYRWSRPPWYRTHGIGFRCVASPKK